MFSEELIGMFWGHINKIIVQMCQLAECHKKSFCSSRWQRVIYKRTRAVCQLGVTSVVQLSSTRLKPFNVFFSNSAHTYMCIYTQTRTHTHVCSLLLLAMSMMLSHHDRETSKSYQDLASCTCGRPDYDVSFATASVTLQVCINISNI